MVKQCDKKSRYFALSAVKRFLFTDKSWISRRARFPGVLMQAGRSGFAG